jgi:hypothetical protein
MLIKQIRRKDMPKLLVHLWIADKLAGGNKALKDPDFYLGNIAPDSIYSRNAEIEPLKKQTHMIAPIKTWEGNVMRKFKSISNPTLFELGYYMHIITDIRFRKLMREFYDRYNVGNKRRSYYDRVIIPLAIRKLFDSEQAYRDCVSYARLYKPSSFPFSITKTDIENNFLYADNIFEIKKIIIPESELDIPLPDYKVMCEDVMCYLLTVFNM